MVSPEICGTSETCHYSANDLEHVSGDEQDGWSEGCVDRLEEPTTFLMTSFRVITNLWT